MEPILKARTDDHSAPSGGSWSQGQLSASSDDSAAMRAELDRLRQREAQIMTLIGCQNPDKLMHDLRNVLNELQLLRMLAETEDKA